ncbi:DUF4123 domain-containing protein [Pseudomonas sp. EA_105y_Pfl2_R69]|uniref:DUF4123 domain-containing protein n=1 Tax=Pseudomonas sp. EA_105y_Pfl2_R69 TaxID=3088683 RepID=UPI0030D90C58
MTTTGALLFDGASHKQAEMWLRQTFTNHWLRPLLNGTPYELLADIGPILVEAEHGSDLHNAWAQGDAGLEHAVWLATNLPFDQLFNSLQRRLRILSPDGREFWLRLADARPLHMAWQAQSQWPQGFWHGVTEVWLPTPNGPLQTWSNPSPEFDCTTVTQSINAQITLDWPLLEALTHDKDSTPEIDI